MAQFNLNRAGRENQIIMVFQLAHERGNGDEMTSFDIARHIGMKGYSSSFRDVLSCMVRDGKLKAREVQGNRTGVNGGRYFAFSLGVLPEQKKREIAVKAKGVQVGQLRLI